MKVRNLLIVGYCIVQDPRAPRFYLFSDEHNMYNLVVSSSISVYSEPASFGQRPILRYQVLQVRKKLYSLYLQSEDWFLRKL